MKRHISLLALFAASVAGAETYYHDSTGVSNIWGDENLFNSASVYSLSKDEIIRPESAPSVTTDLVFYKGNNGSVARINTYSVGGYVNLVKSITATTAMEIWDRSTITTVGDWDMSASMDNVGSGMRFAIDMSSATERGIEIINVGGDMNLSTSKYFTTKFSRRKDSANHYLITVKGALSLDYTGGSDGTGYHQFDLKDAQSTKNTGLKFELGGLASSGRGVYVTSSKADEKVTSFTFVDNDGVFKGGSFTGVFATESSVSASVNFAMNGSGTQSIKIYKAANAAECGLDNLTSKQDMTITTLNVSNGVMNFDTEIEIETGVSVSGGRLNLTSSANLCDIEVSGGYLNLAASADVSAVRLIAGMLELNSSGTINMLNIDRGDIVFGDTASVQSFNVFADNVGVYFDAEDLASNQLTILEFEESEISAEADTVFTALDSNGNELGGKFEVVDNKLVYFTAAVPEPATIAGILGALALAFALYRRRK